MENIQDPPSLAFLGPFGTYTHQAAFERFGNNVQYHEKKRIADVFNSVCLSEVSFAVIPKENSIFGPVVETYDLLRSPSVGWSSSCSIRGEIVLKVQHCLVVRRGVKLGEVKRVLSHEQALGQSRTFLTENLPNAILVKTTSTAAAAEALTQNTPEASQSAAICSRLCASVFDGLEVLHEGVQNEKNNFTKFFILSSSKNSLFPNSEAALSEDTGKAVLRMSMQRSPNDSAESISSRQGLYQPLSIVEEHLLSIDRRPSLTGEPFHDTYILELCNSHSGKTEDTLGRSGQLENGMAKTRTWESIVFQLVERINAVGWEASILGIW